MISEFRRGNRLSLLLQKGQGKGKKRRRLFLSGIILLAVSLFIYLFALSPPSPLEEQPETISSASGEPQPQDAQDQVIEGEIEAGGTFFQSLAAENVPPQRIDWIVSTLRPHVDFRKIRGGTFRLITDGTGELKHFTYEAGPTEVFEIRKASQGYVVQRVEVPLETHLVKVEGEIRFSLFEAMNASGEHDRLAISFADILAWEIDFYKDVKEGDRFRVIVEKLYKEDQFIRYGRIHAVEYQSGDQRIRGIEYQGHYYHEDGTSLRKTFLKTPLRFSRISSRFSRARNHPILGGVLPHYGVDYAAPQGTPVWAVADGVVVSMGWSGGFGKQLILQHMNGYKTYYGHLSRYGPGIKRGVRVKQKQIIGYVGSTGLSTGPHLDYRLSKDGRFKNPLRERFPSGLSIEKGAKEAFQERRDEVVAWLEADAPFGQKPPPLTAGKAQ